MGEHPTLVMLGAFLAAYFFIHLSGCVMVFICGVLLPIKFTILHAALRLRNMKNKTYNSRWPAWLRLQELEKRPLWLSSWLSGALSLTSSTCHKQQLVTNSSSLLIFINIQLI